MALLIGTIGVLILGLIVFGGGQVFMPLYKSLWELMNHNGASISDTNIENIFTVANSTPGVVSTKFSLFTGYLAANGEWWGWLALILTYLVFCIPSIVMILLATKMIKKSETSKYLKDIIKYLRPVIIGVILSLSIQLLLGTVAPFLTFNGYGEYLNINNGSSKADFFSGWRRIALVAYVVIVIPESFLLYKRKFKLFYLIIIHIIIGMLVFQPWL